MAAQPERSFLVAPFLLSADASGELSPFPVHGNGDALVFLVRKLCSQFGEYFILFLGHMLFKHAQELADLGHPRGIVLGHHMKVEEILLQISMLAVEVIRTLRGSLPPKRRVTDVFFFKSMFVQDG